MQEEVENKTVQLAIQTTKVSAKTMIKGLYAWYRQHQKKKDLKPVEKDTVKGRQSVKELIGQNQGVSGMEIADSGIREFKKIAGKYGVDYAMVKDTDGKIPKYTVFFKARDADAITHIITEYTSKHTQKKERSEQTEKPSILQKLKDFKEKVAAMPRRDREKRKEQER